jgi:putative transcriptional regulator
LAIIINIDVMLAKRKMSVTELADKVGITIANISVLKNGKAKAIRLSTLEAICKALQCQPGDILEYEVPLESIAAPQAKNSFPLVEEGQGHAGKAEDQRHVAFRSLPPAAARAAGGQG